MPLLAWLGDAHDPTPPPFALRRSRVGTAGRRLRWERQEGDVVVIIDSVVDSVVVVDECVEQ
jgi:hypothetical protein